MRRGDRKRRCVCPQSVGCGVLVLLVSAMTIGCGPTPQASQTPTAIAAEAIPVQSGIERLLPLMDATVFTYTAWLAESPNPEQLILQVSRPTPRRVDLRSGNNVKRLEYVADGVRLVTGGYLLKEPLSEGADFAGPAGRVRITGLDRDVRVQAGHFVGCLETTESGQSGSGPRSIVTTYCPDVGIVKFSVDDGERQERFELKSFGPRVDVNAL
jgi:hypothetical protein